MAGEVLADDNSPMMMTVAQYNDRVAYTWKLATEAEQERIIKLLEETIRKSNQELNVIDGNWYPAALKMQNDLANFIALINGEK